MLCWRFQALYKIREPFTIYHFGALTTVYVCKRVLNLLEAIYLRLRKIVAERDRVVKFAEIKKYDYTFSQTKYKRMTERSITCTPHMHNASKIQNVTNITTSVWTRRQPNGVDHNVMKAGGRSGFDGSNLNLYRSIDKMNGRSAPRTDLLLITETNRFTVLKPRTRRRLPIINLQCDLRRRNLVFKRQTCLWRRIENGRLKKWFLQFMTKYHLEKILCIKTVNRISKLTIKPQLECSQW